MLNLVVGVIEGIIKDLRPYRLMVRLSPPQGGGPGPSPGRVMKVKEYSVSASIQIQSIEGPS